MGAAASCLQRLGVVERRVVSLVSRAKRARLASMMACSLRNERIVGGDVENEVHERDVVVMPFVSVTSISCMDMSTSSS